jgi:hypothetical protein
VKERKGRVRKGSKEGKNRNQIKDEIWNVGRNGQM